MYNYRANPSQEIPNPEQLMINLDFKSTLYLFVKREFKSCFNENLLRRLNLSKYNRG